MTIPNWLAIAQDAARKIAREEMSKHLDTIAELRAEIERLRTALKAAKWSETYTGWNKPPPEHVAGQQLAFIQEHNARIDAALEAK